MRYKAHPYILGTSDQRVLAAKGQSVYARGAGLEVGQRYGVYREGEPYMLTDANGQKFNAGIELTRELLQVLQYVVKMTSPHLN